MKSYTGFSPVLKYVYIGSKLNDIKYGPIDFRAREGDILVMQTSNCRVLMECLNDEDEVVLHDDNFVASKTIRGLSDSAYITLCLDGFNKYYSVTANECKHETETYGSIVQHILWIPAGEEIKVISVVGEYEKLLFKENAASIMTRKGYSPNLFRFYAAKTSNDIIVRNRETRAITYTKIRRSDLTSNIAAKVSINSANEAVQAMFLEQGQGTSIIANSCETSFDYITFYPTKTKIYKAINEYNVISRTTVVPSIVNTFDNGYGGIS